MKYRETTERLNRQITRKQSQLDQLREKIQMVKEGTHYEREINDLQVETSMLENGINDDADRLADLKEELHISSECPADRKDLGDF